VATLFVSDLHLDGSRPAATDAFLNFLENEAATADALYILGDLFEFWIGDDDPNAEYQRVTAALAKLTATGVRCHIMHGNRDFMLGREFFKASGTIFLHDPTLIYVGGESVLLSHGDALCTDDVGYQRFRRIVRNPIMQNLYNAMPFSWRQLITLKIRGSSKAKYGSRPPEILDVNEQAVKTFLCQYGVRTLLHGHTHRPAIHTIDINGKVTTRIVLGDWYSRSSVLRWDTNGPQLQHTNF
jgi:UDP-2,3-diacylglucosamine hydrolase